MAKLDAPGPAAGAPSAPSDRLRAVTLLFVCGALYGLSFSLNRIAIGAGVPPAAYVFWQAFGAGFLLLLAGAATGRLPPRDRAHLRAYLVMGGLGFVGPFGVAALVASRIPVGVMALVVALVPPFTYVMVLAFRLERFGWPRFAGLGLGVAGMLVLLLPEASLPHRDMTGWVLLALAVPICLAATGVCMQTLRPPGSSALAMACGLLLAAALLLFAIMAVSGGWWAFGGGFGPAQIAVLGAIALHALLWPMIFAVVRLAGAFFVSFLDYVATLSGIGWGMLLFGERHSEWVWGSVTLMLAAVYLVNRRTAPAVSKA